MKNSDHFNFYRKSMIESLEQMNIENFHIFKQLLTKQLQICENMVDIQNFQSEHQISLVSDTSKDHAILQEVIEETKNIETSPQKYRFERKLRGGYIREIDGYVPEGVVRNLEIQHGDYLYAIEVEPGYHQKKRFEYSIAEKGLGIEPSDRIQYNYCPVEVESGRLVVKKSLDSGEDIRLDEVAYTVILNDDDIHSLNIKENDIVDIAFPLGKPETNRILWRHNTENLDTWVPPLKSGHYKKTKQQGTTEMINKCNLDFDSKTILVVGLEARKSVFEKEIDARGGTMIWASGNEELSRLEAMVKKSDLAVIIISHVSHRGSIETVRYCKNHGIPFTPVKSRGVESLITAINESIQATTHIA